MEEARRPTMIIDCQLSGISGDMMLAALLALGADESKVTNAIESVKEHVEWCQEIKLKISDTRKGEFKAKAVDIEIEEVAPSAEKGRPFSKVREATINSVKSLKLSDQARTYASEVVNTLLEAEERVHGKLSEEEAELHELGSTDTVADIVGTTVALDDLKALADASIFSTPVAVGGGIFKFSHGVLQSPGPVTLEILRKFSFPMVGGPVEGELATPTGVALLTNLVNGRVIEFYPSMKPIAIGYGAGKRDLGEVPNLLRIVLGESENSELMTDKVYVLETNLDDVNGEVIGFLMERLLHEKVRDVCVIPVTMKKGRPGQILKVLTDEGEVERISRIIIDETGSLGVRHYPVNRYVLLHEIVPIDVLLGGVVRRINVKVGKTINGEIISVKPEYEDVRSLSVEMKKPFREIEDLIKKAAKTRIEEK
jgi:uncharacterized protein (TIGR00299 family) protein